MIEYLEDLIEDMKKFGENLITYYVFEKNEGDSKNSKKRVMSAKFISLFPKRL